MNIFFSSFRFKVGSAFFPSRIQIRIHGKKCRILIPGYRVKYSNILQNKGHEYKGKKIQEKERKTGKSGIITILNKWTGKTIRLIVE